MAQKDKYFSMRIEDGTRQALAEIAEKTGRTSSAMVAYLVLKEAKRLGIKALLEKDKKNG